MVECTCSYFQCPDFQIYGLTLVCIDVKFLSMGFLRFGLSEESLVFKGISIHLPAQWERITGAEIRGSHTFVASFAYGEE